jgi:hypothetical protein
VSRARGAWKIDHGSAATWTEDDVRSLVIGDRYAVRTSEGIGLSVLVGTDGKLVIETRAGVDAAPFVGLRATRRVPRGSGGA